MRELLELAVATPERHAFQAAALEHIDRSIGIAGGFLLGFETRSEAGPGTATFAVSGFGPWYASRLARQIPCYETEIAPVKRQALRHGGVAVDTDVLGSRVRRTRYYRELAHPAGGGHSLLCFLALRGRAQGLLMLAREQRAPFDESDIARVRTLQPALALALASYSVRTTTGVAPFALALTARERAIGDYLVRGFTNREIALALGTSPNTVRNQLASLFRKAEVSTRAELVGRLLQH